jgi:hypothetical protein
MLVINQINQSNAFPASHPARTGTTSGATILQIRDTLSRLKPDLGSNDWPVNIMLPKPVICLVLTALLFLFSDVHAADERQRLKDSFGLSVSFSLLRD